MKNFFFIVLFLLQFSVICFSQTDCFSQADSIHRCNNSEIKILSNYIKELENKNPTITNSESNAAEKKQIDQLLNDDARIYSDMDIIKLVKYIKSLEKANGLAITSGEENVTDKKPIAKDSLNIYSN